MSNVLLSGIPGIGKTTIIEHVLPALHGKAGGFITREIRSHGGRVGFRIIDLKGEEGILAHVCSSSTVKVGRYGIDRKELERIGVSALERALQENDIIVIDEIGAMELCSPRFRRIVTECLDASKDVLAVIQMKRIPFLEAIRCRPDVVCVNVTKGNRARIPETIVSMFQSKRVSGN